MLGLPSSAALLAQLPYWTGTISCLFILTGVLLKRLRNRPTPPIQAATTTSASKLKSNKSKRAKKATTKEKPEESPSEINLLNLKLSPRTDVQVTEATREEISKMFSSVQSLSAPAPSPAAAQPAATEALHESGVLSALAADLVSEPTTDVTPAGKFSKMTIEASFIFDDEKLT